MLLLLATGLAQGGPEAWEAIHDGRLIEALGGDPSEAVLQYEQALSYLEEGDPDRPELMYWLGRARYTAGDIEGARTALRAALDDPRWQDRAWAFLSRVEARVHAVSKLPHQEDFSRSFGALVRGWTRFSEGGLERLDGVSPGGTALKWSTVVREGEPDFIYVFLKELRRPPRRIRIFMSARGFPAHVRFVAEDTEGRRWTGPVVTLSTTEWVAIDQQIRDFVLEEDPQAGRMPPGTHLRLVQLYDVTAQTASDRGDNVILIDDFELL